MPPVPYTRSLTIFQTSAAPPNCIILSGLEWGFLGSHMSVALFQTAAEPPDFILSELTGGF